MRVRGHRGAGEVGGSCVGLELHKANQIFAKDLKALAPRAALFFRPAMLPDLDRAGCLEGAVAVWSRWAGYLARERGAEVSTALDARGIPLEALPTSGHAGIAEALAPIHTFEPHRFPGYFGAMACRKNGGEWWEIVA